MHWADVVAEKLLEQKDEHVISSGITPSGPIHLGSMREILTADAIVRAINDKGGKAKLIYIADNADPLRKVYPFLDKKKYENYLILTNPQNQIEDEKFQLILNKLPDSIYSIVEKIDRVSIEKKRPITRSLVAKIFKN